MRTSSSSGAPRLAEGRRTQNLDCWGEERGREGGRERGREGGREGGGKHLGSDSAVHIIKTIIHLQCFQVVYNFI